MEARLRGVMGEGGGGRGVMEAPTRQRLRLRGIVVGYKGPHNLRVQNLAERDGFNGIAPDSTRGHVE